MPVSAGMFVVSEFLDDTEYQHSLTSAKDFVAAAKGNYSCLTPDAEKPEDWAATITVFRGQVDASWGLRSSLVRDVAPKESDVAALTEKTLGEAEGAIIKAARGGRGSSGSKTIGGPDQLGMNLSDGQLLAVMQHQEIPTRFLDVTESGLIGLFFACETEDSRDGRVFIITFASPPDGRQQPALVGGGDETWLSLGSGPSSAGLPWPEVTTEQYASSVWSQALHLVDAGGLDPRMTAQRGIFMVGGLPRTYAGGQLYWSQHGPLPAECVRQLMSLPVQLRTAKTRTGKPKSQKLQGFRAYGRTLRVPAVHKRAIRELLAEDHGISTASIYPDFAGFRRLAHEIARRA